MEDQQNDAENEERSEEECQNKEELSEGVNIRENGWFGNLRNE
jgi:hypothetical protein